DIYKDEDKRILFAMSKTHRFNKWLASYLKPYLGNIVLEIGSGIGTMALEFLPVDHYTCSDIDPIHIDKLHNIFMNRPNVDVMQLNIEDERDIKKVQGRYDTVLCINVLEHLEDHVQVLSNINRLLVKGGKAIVLVPNCPFLYNSFDKVLGHKRRYKTQQVKDLLKEAGFGISHLKTFNKISIIGWFINGTLFKRRHFSRIQLKCFDLFVWLWKGIDPFLPWPGQSIIAVAEKMENV
ncbi:MAG: class I SAM-dependent methyltransferase, partial [bacterium]